MADTITEFINVSGKKLSELTSPGLNILTNSPTQTAVIKDVIVNNPNGRELVLQVPPNDIVRLSSDARLTGAELIGAGTSVKLVSRSVPIFNDYTTYSWFTQAAGPGVLGPLVATTNRLKTIFNDSTPKAGDSFTTVKTTTGAAPVVPPDFICADSAGNIYYATQTNNWVVNGVGATLSGTTNKLYKRTGGVNGPETAVFSLTNTTATAGTTQTFTWDGKRYIHILHAANNSSGTPAMLTTYDTQTNTTSSFNTTLLYGDGSTFGMAGIAAIDEFVFVTLNKSTTVHVLNHIAKTYLGLFSPGFGPDSTSAQVNPTLIAGKNTQGNYYLVSTNYNTTGAIITTFGPEIVSPTTATYRQATVSMVIKGEKYTYSSLRWSGRWAASPASSKYVFLIAVSSIAALNVETGENWLLNPLKELPTVASTSTVNVPDIQAAEADYGTIGIRVTGIKTT